MNTFNTFRLFRQIFTLSVALLGYALLISSASAASIYVSESGGGDGSSSSSPLTLGAAIASASSGDTLYLVEDIDITETVTLPTSVSIDGGAFTMTCSVVTPDSSKACLRLDSTSGHNSFTFQNLTLTTSDADATKYLIYSKADIELALNSVTVKDYRGSTQDTVIYMRNSWGPVQIENSTFNDNEDILKVYFLAGTGTSSSQITLKNNTFTKNDSIVYAEEVSILDVTNNTIDKCINLCLEIGLETASSVTISSNIFDTFPNGAISILGQPDTFYLNGNQFLNGTNFVFAVVLEQVSKGYIYQNYFEGIDPDSEDNGSGLQIIKTSTTDRLSVFNNIFYQLYMGIHVKEGNPTLGYNTIDSSKAYGIYISEDASPGVFNNNITDEDGRGGKSITFKGNSPGATEIPSLAYNNFINSYSLAGTYDWDGNISVAPDYIAGTLKPDSSSSLIDAASSKYFMLARDFDGYCRYELSDPIFTGLNPDIGAYENSTASSIKSCPGIRSIFGDKGLYSRS